MSTAHDDRFAELLSSYALGVLEEGDLRSVEEHLAAGCDTCDAELLKLSETLETMADSVAPVEPSDIVRARTLRSIEATTDTEQRTGLSGAWRAAIAAGLVLLVWSGWTQSGLRRDVDRLAADRDELRQELSSVRTALVNTRGELARTRLANRIVSAPGSGSVLLAGLEAAPESSARAYVDPGTNRAVFYASNLQPLDADQTYQLWFIADGTPVSAGTFEVDGEGSGSVLVDQVAAAESLEAWAVTIEPAGGVPQPTGPMVLLGSAA